MKVLIARMNHETNTFSPVPTPLSAFGNDGPTYRRRRLRREQGQAHRHVRLHRPGRSARRRAGHAGVGHGLPQRAGGRRGLQGTMRPHRRRRARLRRAAAGSAWRHGGRDHRRRRGRPAGTAAPGRAGRAGGRGAGPARQRHAEDGGQRRRHHQLQDLSPRRHVRNRRARRPHPVRLAGGRTAPGAGLAPPAADDPHAAQRHGRGRHARGGAGRPPG